MLKDKFESLPRNLQRLLSPLVGLYRGYRKVLWDYRQEVIIYEGVEIASEKPLCVAYAGRFDEHKYWWLQTIFGNRYTSRSLGDVWVRRVLSRIRKAAPACAMAWIETTTVPRKLFRPRHGFSVPFWVEFEMDITDEALKTHNLRFKDIRRKIKKYGLTHLISREEKDFKFFYEQMHLPYIRGRHGKAARIPTYDFLRDVFLKEGKLLLVWQGDVPIAGVLIQYERGEAVLLCLGVTEGRFELVHRGGIGALIYFAVEELRKEGYQSFNFGGSRPLLQDGALRFKALFGSRVIGKKHLTDHRAQLYLFRDTPALRHYLKANPFIFVTDAGEYHRAVFLDSEMGDSHATIRKFLDHCWVDGLTGTHVYWMGGGDHCPDLSSDDRPQENCQWHFAEEIFSGFTP